MSHTHAGRRKDVISTLAHLSEEPEHGGHPKKTTEAEQGCQYNGDWVLLLNFTIRQSLTWHRLLYTRYIMCMDRKHLQSSSHPHVSRSVAAVTHQSCVPLKQVTNAADHSNAKITHTHPYIVLFNPPTHTPSHKTYTQARVHTSLNTHPPTHTHIICKITIYIMLTVLQFIKINSV